MKHKIGRLAAALFSSCFLALPGAASVVADSKPLDQKGHDERLKREERTKERVDRENKVQRDQDAIRERARTGGYEGDYDKAVDRYGAPRTKGSVDKSRPRPGAGHTGDNDQPGLTGKEGGR